MRLAYGSLLTALAALVMATPANAVVFNFNATTAEHPVPSNLSLEILIPNLGVASTLGPVSVSGSGNVTTNLDIVDSGTVQINSSTLNLSNFGPSTLNLGAFGTLDASLSSVGVSIVGGPVAVTTNNFSINSSTPGSIAINSGSVILSNPTGLLAIFLPGGTSINFATNPVNVPFSSLGTGSINGTTDDDVGLLDGNGAEVNIPLDTTVEVTNLSGLPILARLFGNVNLGSSVTAIPEASTMVLLSIAMASAAGIAGARKMFGSR